MGEPLLVQFNCIILMDAELLLVTLVVLAGRLCLYREQVEPHLTLKSRLGSEWDFISRNLPKKKKNVMQINCLLMAYFSKLRSVQLDGNP